MNMYSKYFHLSQQFLKVVTPLSQSTFLKINHENNLLKRWAGHSKWQNIKATKEANDRHKSMAFQKIIQQITQCAKKGGPNPVSNPKLQAVIEEAKKINMPKATIEKALKGVQTQTIEKPYWVVFLGPKGIVLGVEVLFANKKPGFLQGKLGSVTKKLSFKIEPHYDHLCTERGLIIAEPLNNVENSYESAIEVALEIGMDEVHEQDDKSLIFECSPERMDSYASRISEKGYNIQSSSVELDFKNFVTLEQDEVENMEKLISTLYDRFEEVIRVSYNVVKK